MPINFFCGEFLKRLLRVKNSGTLICESVAALKLLRSSNIATADERLIYATVSDLTVSNMMTQLKKVMGWDVNYRDIGDLRNTETFTLYNEKKGGKLDCCFNITDDDSISLMDSYQESKQNNTEDKIHHDFSSSENFKSVNNPSTTYMEITFQNQEVTRHDRNDNTICNESDANTNNKVEDIFDTHQKSNCIEINKPFIGNTKLISFPHNIIEEIVKTANAKLSPTNNKQEIDSTKNLSDISKSVKQFKNTEENFKSSNILCISTTKPKRRNSAILKCSDKINVIKVDIEQNGSELKYSLKYSDYSYKCDMFENKGIIYHHQGRKWETKSVGDNYHRKCYKGIIICIKITMCITFMNYSDFGIHTYSSISFELVSKIIKNWEIDNSFPKEERSGRLIRYK